jgi:hypothetical protein
LRWTCLSAIEKSFQMLKTVVSGERFGAIMALLFDFVIVVVVVVVIVLFNNISLFFSVYDDNPYNIIMLPSRISFLQDFFPFHSCFIYQPYTFLLLQVFQIVLFHKAYIYQHITVLI